MNVMELCQSLQSALAQLEAARRGAQDGTAIDQRTQQWNERLGTLSSAHQCADWLQVDLSQVPSYPDQFNYARELAQQAAQRLEQRPSIEVLTEEDLWVRLLQTTQKAADAAWEQIKRVWNIKLEEYRQLSPSQQLRATASPLPQNDALLAEYEVQYRAASRLAGLEVPRSATDPETLARAIETCRTLAAQLRFDAPKEVEEFFRAINGGGAPLTLVTPTVLTWLTESGQLGGYTVRSRGR